MKALSYDDWAWIGRCARDNSPFFYVAIDDLDIHDAAFVACQIREKYGAIAAFNSIMKQKLEMPPMFDGMTI